MSSFFAVRTPLDIQNIGDSALKAELTGIIEHTLSGRAGEWRKQMDRCR